MPIRRHYVLFRPGDPYPTNWSVRAYYPDVGQYSRMVQLYGSREEARGACKGNGQWFGREPGDDVSVEGVWL